MKGSAYPFIMETLRSAKHYLMGFLIFVVFVVMMTTFNIINNTFVTFSIFTISISDSPFLICYFKTVSNYLPLISVRP